MPAMMNGNDASYESGHKRFVMTGCLKMTILTLSMYHDLDQGPLFVNII